MKQVTNIPEPITWLTFHTTATKVMSARVTGISARQEDHNYVGTKYYTPFAWTESVPATCGATTKSTIEVVIDIHNDIP